MSKDYAKAHKTAPPPEPTPKRLPWFLSGFVLGAFLAFLGALWLMQSPATTVAGTTEAPVAQPEATSDEMQWDFYEIFPRSVVPVVEEYISTGEKVAVDNVRWILQAGSFRDPDDADERRAELLLMGLNVTTAEAVMSGKTWHRVIVGPFDTELERNRAQDKLAQAQIPSIPFTIPRT